MKKFTLIFLLILCKTTSALLKPTGVATGKY